MGAVHLLTIVFVTVLSSNNLVNAQTSDCRPVKTDLVIVVDSSGSVHRVFNMYITAAMEFTKDLSFGPDATEAAIIQYSKSPPILKYGFNSPQNNQAINKTIAELEFLGDTTNTAEAVNLGIQQFANGRPEARKVFVLMTDGNSFDPWQTVKDTSSRLQQTNAVIYVIALGDNLYFPELKLYTGEKGQLITRDDLSKFKADVTDLTGGCQKPGTNAPVTKAPVVTEPATYAPPNTVSTVVLETHPPETYASNTFSTKPVTEPVETTRSTFTYVPSPSPQTSPPVQCPIPEGWCPCTTVTVASTTITTTPALSTTTTTTAAPPTTTTTVATQPQPTTTVAPPSVAPTTLRILKPSSPCAVDILFVLDSSGVDRTNFDKQIRFVLDLLDILTIDPAIHLVASIVYDGHMRQKIQFSFTAYTNIQTLSTAVSGLPFFGGVAAGGEGLTLAKQALLDRRPNVPAVIIVVTNGTSTDDLKGPAAELRKEPNTEVYAISVAENVNKQPLIDIAGDPSHVFVGMDAERVKNVALGKYLNCPNLVARKFRRRI